MEEHLETVNGSAYTIYILSDTGIHYLGVYLAKDANTSSGYYAATARSSWQKSMSSPMNCMALTEVINQPTKFVSSNPHYVIKDTHWIMW